MELSAGPDAGETETIQIAATVQIQIQIQIKIAATILFLAYLSFNTLYNYKALISKSTAGYN